MSADIVSGSKPIGVIGGGAIESKTFECLNKVVETWVAADGGANHLLKFNVAPEAVIGDLDSISPAARDAFSDVLHPIAEQHSTDLEKTLTRISAPLILATGVLGSRIDHSFAALNLLARENITNVLLIQDHELCFLAPPKLSLSLPVGTSIALLPLSTNITKTTGLHWNLENQTLSPDSLISSSNRTSHDIITLTTTGALFITLPLPLLGKLITQLPTYSHVRSRL